MIYICTKRFKRKTNFGTFNIPYGVNVEEHDGWLYYNNQRICSSHSAVMREHFARNDDGLGLKRAKLTSAIIKALQLQPNETKEHWQSRWDVIWADSVSNKYRKDYSETTFLWDIDFYNAPLLELWHIAHLAGVKEEKNKNV